MNRNFCYIFLFYLFYGGFFASAQSETPKINKDNSTIEYNKFERDLTEKYSGNEFQYDRLEGTSQNILARLTDWFFEKLRSIFGIDVDPGVLEIVQNIIYLLLILGGAYLVIRLLVGENAASFFKKKSASVAPMAFEEEQIEQMDVDQLIKDAIAANDYRLAVRYMHLKVLKLLAFKNLIDWHFEKTNRDYYNEIGEKPLKEGFKKASYLYEYIWYGEFAIGEPEFIQTKKHFDQFTTKINSVG